VLTKHVTVILSPRRDQTKQDLTFYDIRSNLNTKMLRRRLHL